jgi:hypothetical protein
MGDVIQLPPQKKRSGVVSENGGRQTAIILLFTGVRYQRMPETPTVKAGGDDPSPHGRKRKRKRG